MSFVKNSVFAEDDIQNNFGGWSWSSNFGWNSENCNNRYFSGYQDYCGIKNDNIILDIGFDGNDVDFDTLEVKDNSKENNTIKIIGTTINNIKNRTGKSNFNKSFEFISGTNIITFDNPSSSLVLPNTVTISFWLKSGPKTQREGLFLLGNDGILTSGSNQRSLSWIINLSNKIEISNVFDWNNQWNYYTIVRNGQNVKAYRNGQYIGMANFTQATSGENLYRIGQAVCNGCGGTLNFNGQIDEIRIYNSILSLDEIIHNKLHNSNYYLDIDNITGRIMGWVWSSSLGWICFGDTCSDYGSPPYGNLSDTILHWSPNQGNGIYPHMITGWAKAISFDDSYQEQFKDTGWIALRGPEIFPLGKNYKNCVSCSVRDEDNGLVAYFKFDEDIGDVASDSSGNNNNGLLQQFIDERWNEDGKINNCLYFDKEKNVVRTPEISLSTSITISWWSKQDVPKDSGIFYLSSFGNQGGIYSAEDGLFLWRIKNSNEIKMPVKFFLFDSNWHNYVAVRTNELVKIYRDGKFIAEDRFENNEEQTLTSIGYTKTEGGDLFFNGFMDHVKIYNRSLTEDEVLYSYNYPENRFCSACFNELDENLNNICYECSLCNTSQDDGDICAECSSCRQYGLAFDSGTANIKGYTWGGFNVDSELSGVGWTKFSPNFAAGLYRSYISTKYGNIYSRSNIGSDYTVIPPLGYFNSTYMIQANGHIINWVSEGISTTTQGSLFYDYNTEEPWMSYYDSPSGFISPVYDYPNKINDYGNILGNLDYEGLKKGIYGNVINNMPNEGVEDYNVCLGGKIYYTKPETGEYKLNVKVSGSEISYLFNNCDNGSGVIIVDGDLVINGDLKYDESIVESNNKELASIAWIIKGDLYINGEVSDLAGTFIVLGNEDVTECGSDLGNPVPKCGTIYTGSSANQLVISGQILAKNFQLERTFRSSLREPSEIIIYDGRNIINPPPGLGDIIKSLPRWDQIAPY
ncbi:MAG: LamG domain-containing protein [Patescibacteria group bacterium]|nr:LamG domain-containing protein [Patescibacteria group bacterium]